MELPLFDFEQKWKDKGNGKLDENKRASFALYSTKNPLNTDLFPVLMECPLFNNGNPNITACKVLPFKYQMPSDYRLLLDKSGKWKKSKNKQGEESVVISHVYINGAKVKIDKIENGVLSGYMPEFNAVLNRQEFEKSYIPNGAVFIFNTERLRETREYYMEKTYPYIMPRDRSVDIDELLDFEWAEFLLKKNPKF